MLQLSNRVLCMILAYALLGAFVLGMIIVKLVRSVRGADEKKEGEEDEKEATSGRK